MNFGSRGTSQREPNDGTTVTCTTRRPGRTRSAASAIARRCRAISPCQARPASVSTSPRPCALGQRDPEMRFEHAQLLADRRGRHGEFVGGGAHRAQARDGIERTHGI